MVELAHCGGLTYEHEGAGKFKMQRETAVIHDLIKGEIRRDLTNHEEADPDFVILPSDGQPVFQIVNFIDDLEMKITHVSPLALFHETPS